MLVPFITGVMVCTYVLCKLFKQIMCTLGKKETTVEKLRSIMAQLEYSHQINAWHVKGVPFKYHVYVPEVHPVTGIEFCEREDEGHVLKVGSFMTNPCYLHVLTCIAYWSKLATRWSK